MLKTMLDTISHTTQKYIYYIAILPSYPLNPPISAADTADRFWKASVYADICVIVWEKVPHVAQ